MRTQNNVNFPDRTWKLFESRVVLFGWGILYAFSLNYCLAEYATAQWSEYGFSHTGFNLMHWSAASTSILLWSTVLPKKIDSPSSLFLIIIYVFVGIPGVVAITALENIYGIDRDGLLPSMTLGFFLSCLMLKLFRWKGPTRKFHPWFPVILTISWMFCAIFLVENFSGIMQFEGLEDIYAQREAGKAKGLMQGYIQTYFGYVLSPTLLAFGFYQRHPVYILFGVGGAVLLYTITAEKAVVMYPLFISAMFFLMRGRSNIFSSVVFITALFSVLLSIAVTFYHQSAVAEFISWYLGTRTLLMPGIFIVHYWDQFSIDGHTLWSQLRGFSLMFEAPTQYLADERWPAIGLIVGEVHLGVSKFNANASFIASDGIASFGAIGILLTFLVFSCFLILLDRVTRGIDPVLLIPLLVPLSLNLTNGSLFTALTSFGGIFWIVCFAFFAKRKANAHFSHI